MTTDLKVLKSFQFRNIFADLQKKTKWTWNMTIFQTLKRYIQEAILEIIYARKIKNRGPKITCDVSKVLDAIFDMTDNGGKCSYIERHYGVKIGSYYRFLNIIIDHQLFERFLETCLAQESLPSLAVVDGTHIRSVDGSEGVSFGFKERGKRAIKLTLLTSTKKVVYGSILHPDNKNDHTAFGDFAINNPRNKPLDVLADAGYNGKDFKAICAKNGYNIISCPKKNMQERPSNYQTLLLKMNRSGIEHVNAQVKRFRAIQVKYNKAVKFFNCYLQLVLLLVSIHNGYIRNGFGSGTPLQSST